MIMQSEDDVTLWINEYELGDFALDLLNVSDNISDLFSRVDTKMSDLKISAKNNTLPTTGELVYKPINYLRVNFSNFFFCIVQFFG